MADTKISNLTEASALTGAELFLASQSAADVKASLQRLRDELYWARPTDWPAMPSDAANKVSILAAVWNNGSNYCALTVAVSSGTYDVDWGDGSSSTGVTSNTAATHTYDYADADLPSVTSRGYKIATIVITPNTGGANITTLNLSTAPTPSGNPWLEVLANVPSCTSLAFSAAASPSLCLERAIVSAISSSITTLASCFSGARSLRAFSFPASFAGNVTTLASMFDSCFSLEHVDFRGWGFDSSLVTATSLVRLCSSLRTLQYDSGMFNSITSADSMFSGCTALRELEISLAACTNFNSFLQNATRIQRLVITAAGAATNINSIVNGASALREIHFPSGFGGSISSATNAFSTTTQLSRIVNLGIPISFTVASAKLSATALDEIYTGLPSVTATITVTSNFGTSGDTPSIATGKGWTVTG